MNYKIFSNSMKKTKYHLKHIKKFIKLLLKIMLLEKNLVKMNLKS